MRSQSLTKTMMLLAAFASLLTACAALPGPEPFSAPLGDDGASEPVKPGSWAAAVNKGTGAKSPVISDIAPVPYICDYEGEPRKITVLYGSDGNALVAAQIKLGTQKSEVMSRDLRVKGINLYKSANYRWVTGPADAGNPQAGMPIEYSRADAPQGDPSAAVLTNCMWDNGRTETPAASASEPKPAAARKAAPSGRKASAKKGAASRKAAASKKSKANKKSAAKKKTAARKARAKKSAARKSPAKKKAKK